MRIGILRLVIRKLFRGLGKAEWDLTNTACAQASPTKTEGQTKPHF